MVNYFDHDDVQGGVEEPFAASLVEDLGQAHALVGQTALEHGGELGVSSCRNGGLQQEPRAAFAFGVAFELPLFVFFLSITGIVSARQLFSATPYAVLIVFIVRRPDWERLDWPRLRDAGVRPHHFAILANAEEQKLIRYRNDAHLNESGHALFGRALADMIEPYVRQVALRKSAALPAAPLAGPEDPEASPTGG